MGNIDEEFEDKTELFRTFARFNEHNKEYIENQFDKKSIYKHTLSLKETPIIVEVITSKKDNYTVMGDIIVDTKILSISYCDTDNIRYSVFKSNNKFYIYNNSQLEELFNDTTILNSDTIEKLG